MRRLRRTVLCLGLLLAAGCRIEDHTPTGSRRDEEAVQSLVARYARTLSERDWSGGPRAVLGGRLLLRDRCCPRPAPATRRCRSTWRSASSRVGWRGSGCERFDVRVLRSDYRQEGDLAAVWLTTRRLLPVAGSVIDGEWIEHLVLRRIDGEWRILSLAATASRRGAARESR